MTFHGRLRCTLGERNIEEHLEVFSIPPLRLSFASYAHGHLLYLSCIQYISDQAWCTPTVLFAKHVCSNSAVCRMKIHDYNQLLGLLFPSATKCLCMSLASSTASTGQLRMLKANFYPRNSTEARDLHRSSFGTLHACCLSPFSINHKSQKPKAQNVPHIHIQPLSHLNIRIGSLRHIPQHLPHNRHTDPRRASQQAAITSNIP